MAHILVYCMGELSSLHWAQPSFALPQAPIDLGHTFSVRCVQIRRGKLEFQTLTVNPEFASCETRDCVGTLGGW